MIRLGVIGTGAITARHLDVAAECPDVEISAICGRRAGPRRAIAERYRIPAEGDDYQDLLRRDSIDAVLVLVAPEAMETVAGAALESGKPTFLEKPPGLSVAAAEALAETAARRRTPNMVGLNRRFYSTISQARAVIEAAGALRGLRVEAPEDLGRARAAGRSEALLSRWTYANSLHAIDLVRHLGGALRSGHVLRDVGDVPDMSSVVATFELARGGIAEYVAHWGSPGPWNVTMYGDGVTAVLSPLEEASVMHRSRTPVSLPVHEVDRQFKPGFYRQMKAFVEMVHKGTAPFPAADVADAVESMRLAGWLTGEETTLP